MPGLGKWCYYSNEQFVPGSSFTEPQLRILRDDGQVICPGCNRSLKLRDGLNARWKMIPRHKRAA
jgi:hypothetical protein